MNNLYSFYKNKKVLITGHTGFKGSWMCMELLKFGADIVGYALKPSQEVNLFDLCALSKEIKSYEGDVRDLQNLLKVFKDEKPEIVIHMAAQPIVRESYKNPVYTYDVNVMGTVNVLECVRLCDSVKSFVNVTTDKVYLNRDLNNAFKEDEMLCGYDPYSNSKSCSELVTYAYRNSFFGGDNCVTGDGRTVAVSTCRAGNVIGGGDFATDRIIPDCVRAVEKGEEIIVRNPFSTRPYEHVLEPVYVYLMLAMKQYSDTSFAGCYNVGPNDEDCVTTGELVNLFCDIWNSKLESNGLNKASWIDKSDGGPHEAAFLKLDSSKLRNTFSWAPSWDIKTTMDKIIDWTEAYLLKEDFKKVMEDQIDDFLRNQKSY